MTRMMDNAGRGLNTGNFNNNPAGRQARESFVGHWANSSAIWTVRRGVGEAVDRMVGLHQNVGTPSNVRFMSTIEMNRLKEQGYTDRFVKRYKPVLGYSDILKARTNYVSWKDLSWDNFWRQVKRNTADLRKGLSSPHRKDFFKGVHLRDYARYTLWEENVRPFKTLFSTNWQTNLFSNLAYTAGVGMMGYGIFDSSRQAYKNAKAKEDGSWQSRVETWKETGEAFLGKLAKSFVSWECANKGLTLGRMLIPIGAFPIGGIVVGALMGTVAYSLLDKLFPEPEKTH